MEDSTHLSFLPPHGGYQQLRSYQKAEIVYDGTVHFTGKFLKKGDRTIDQMVQAARSGKQNIAEGSLMSATSKELKLKLTNVARASLEELMIDYRDFIRVRHLEIWPQNHHLVLRLKELNASNPAGNYQHFQQAIEHPDPEIAANVLLNLARLAQYLLKLQLKRLEQDFITQGGIRERMATARRKYKNNNPDGA